MGCAGGCEGSATLTVAQMFAGLDPRAFVSQPSYTGSCLATERPPGSICLGFSDGYRWLIYYPVTGWRTDSPYNGYTVRVAIGLKAEYQHVLMTDLVMEVKIP